MVSSYQQGWITALTPIEPAVPAVRVTTLAVRTSNLTSIARGKWSLVTDLMKKKGALPGQVGSKANNICCNALFSRHRTYFIFFCSLIPNKSDPELALLRPHRHALARVQIHEVFTVKTNTYSFAAINHMQLGYIYVWPLMER